MSPKTKNWLTIPAAALVLALLFGIFLWLIPSLEKKQKEEELKLLFREYYEKKVAEFEAENPLLWGVDVAFLGDSLTEGYDLNLYYPEFTTANRGIGGDTSFGVEERLKASVYDLNPRSVVLLIGGNNVETMMENYEAILLGISEHLPHTKVVLVSVPPRSGSARIKNGQILLNNQQIQVLAAQYGFSYVDLYTPLLDPDQGELRAEYTPDGAHFTSQGYEIYTSLLKPILEEQLLSPAAAQE